MKHPLRLGIATLVLPFLSASAAVGTLLVQNNNGSTVVPIYDVDGTTKIGANFSIGVYVVNPDGSVISQLGGFTTAATSNGRFTLGQLDVGVAGGTVFLAVHAWDLRTGATYATALIKSSSSPFLSPVLGGDADNNPNTPGLSAQSMALNFKSFRIGIPEPPTLALAALGLGGLILVNQRKLPGVSNDLD